MTQRKILILNGHPYEKSFVHALADAYYRGALAAGHDVVLVHLRDLQFDPILRSGYSEVTPLEPDLVKQQELLTWCEHLVVVTPLWWMSFSALLKGYFDRILLPRFAYKYHKPILGVIPNWSKLLTGRSARVIYTQGSPRWISRTFLLDCVWRGWKWGVIGFCGFKPLRRCEFCVTGASDAKRARMIEKVEKLGRRGI
jgi:putative NADPH-quinone reductase